MNDVRAQPAASSPSPQVASLIVGFPEAPDDRRPVKVVYGPYVVSWPALVSGGPGHEAHEASRPSLWPQHRGCCLQGSSWWLGLVCGNGD